MKGGRRNPFMTDQARSGIMDSPPAQPESLDAIRQEIDRIDDGILKLVAERLALVDRISVLKAAAKGDQATPIRPGREAAILRRIIKEAAGAVPAELCLTLWRALISAATQRQATVRVHGASELFASAGAHLLIRDHFGSADLVGHADESAAFAALAGNPSDVAAFATDEASWIAPYLKGLAGKAQVVGCLPFLAREAMPRILIFGHAAPEPTGADETLVIAAGEWPRELAPAPLWRMQTAGRTLASLPGFLPEDCMPLAGFARSAGRFASTVIGRYPSPIEVRT
jgi:chorismate mutase/prephenate dehydratase